MDDTIEEEYSTYGAISEDTSHFRRNNRTDITEDSIDNAPLLSPNQTGSTMQSTINDPSPSTLPLMTKIGFGFGHVYNDLCAGIWFSYTLLFFQGVLQMPSTEAGGLMMLGQVADAIATPIIGHFTDKFGTKQKWHIFGTFLVFVSFPFIFGICPWCSSMPPWWHLTYFTVVIVLFQIGWPIVQVSHLAIIPEMARNQKDRSQLTAVRYSATVISNIIVFVVTFIVLRSHRSKTEDQISPRDAYRFRDISLILTLIGVCMAVCFHISLTFGGYGQRRNQALARRSSDQPYRRIDSTDEEQPGTSTPRQSLLPRQRKNFLKSPKIYQYAFLYVFSRLFTTTSLIYIPLWLDERQKQTTRLTSIDPDIDTSVEQIALVPMVSFVSSFLSSVLMNKSHRICGHQFAYFFGSMAAIVGCVLVETSVSISLTNTLLYGIAIIFGASSSITMISSLCLIADMIGKHAEQSGFVYSAVTFADKLITGIAVIIFESLKCNDRRMCPDYYKQVLARACGGAALLGVLTLLSLKLTRRPRRSRSL